GVEGFAPGDEVFGAVGKPFFGEGTFAEYVTATAALAARRPTNLPAERAAALPTAGGTALAAVDALAAQPGDTAAVVGAAGALCAVRRAGIRRATGDLPRGSRGPRSSGRAWRARRSWQAHSRRGGSPTRAGRGGGASAVDARQPGQAGPRDRLARPEPGRPAT